MALSTAVVAIIKKAVAVFANASFFIPGFRAASKIAPRLLAGAAASVRSHTVRGMGFRRFASKIRAYINSSRTIGIIGSVASFVVLDKLYSSMSNEEIDGPYWNEDNWDSEKEESAAYDLSEYSNFIKVVQKEVDFTQFISLAFRGETFRSALILTHDYLDSALDLAFDNSTDVFIQGSRTDESFSHIIELLDKKYVRKDDYNEIKVMLDSGISFRGYLYAGVSHVYTKVYEKFEDAGKGEIYQLLQSLSVGASFFQELGVSLGFSDSDFGDPETSDSLALICMYFALRGYFDSVYSSEVIVKSDVINEIINSPPSVICVGSLPGFDIDSQASKIESSERVDDAVRVVDSEDKMGKTFYQRVDEALNGFLPLGVKLDGGGK